MATTKTITMKQFNGTDYDTLYPKTIASQIDDVYSKDETLSNATKTLFGLGSTALPNDVLVFLGKFNQYWWSVRHGESYHYYEEVKSDITSNVDINDGYAREISYSSEIIIDNSTGAVTLSNPQTFLVRKSTNASTFASYMQELANLAPIYVTNLQENASAVYYIPVGADVGTSGKTIIYNTYNSAYRGQFSSSATNKAKLVTTKLVQVPAGETTYVYSSERNAYPDSGNVDGFTYQYLGIPFNNAVTAPKTATGSYVGTGTYGVDNPNVLTFDFIPKMIYVRNTNRTMTDYGFMFIPVFCLSDTFNSSGYFIYESASSNEYAKIDESTKKVYWYSASASNSVNAQFNISGNTYEYFAIG